VYTRQIHWMTTTTRHTITPTPPPVGVAEYCDERVCLFVCLFASTSLELHARSSPTFCACYLWPLLGRLLAALRYDMYFRFMDNVIFARNGSYGPPGWSLQCTTALLLTALARKVLQSAVSVCFHSIFLTAWHVIVILPVYEPWR